MTTARNARESLARALNSLQSDPNVPPQLLDLAAPIAQAMGALHQIERSNGTQLVPHAEVALGSVRSALGGLQAQPASHPAVAAALEVGRRLVGPRARPEQTGGSRCRPRGERVSRSGRARSPSRSASQVAPAPQAAPPAQAYAPQAFAPTAAVPQYAPPAPAPVVQQQVAPPAAPRAQPSAAPLPLTRPATNAGGGMNAPAGAPDAALIEAPLGTHSATNFYKGLSGNDIIDHGGLFVSTYMIPKIGAPVRLRVSLPGGYEFEANAVVRWIREQSDSSQDAPPGFGAQFTQITGEARQLVYRYVRNREPLFHDDL
ncbi:MAG: PilZ domain-containing protein [Polyangiaceae bacterium]